MWLDSVLIYQHSLSIYTCALVPCRGFEGRFSADAIRSRKVAHCTKTLGLRNIILLNLSSSSFTFYLVFNRRYAFIKAQAFRNCYWSQEKLYTLYQRQVLWPMACPLVSCCRFVCHEVQSPPGFSAQDWDRRGRSRGCGLGLGSWFWKSCACDQHSQWQKGWRRLGPVW